MLRNFLWLIPFFCFAAGYMVTRYYFAIAHLPVPCVEGKTVYEALTELSNHQLNLKLLKIKKDKDMPHGTILRQIPAPGQMVKPRQTVFVIVSEQPSIPNAPDMVGKRIDQIERELQSLGIAYKIYPITSIYPQKTCFTQYPAAHQPLIDNSLIVYIAQPKIIHYILPNFSGMPLQEALNLLEQYELTSHIIQAKRRSATNESHVIDQQPLPGSLIHLNPQSKPTIQLHVQ
jgi:beta-lactam-binding protein with PASTA domain